MKKLIVFIFCVCCVLVISYTLYVNRKRDPDRLDLKNTLLTYIEPDMKELEKHKVDLEKAKITLKIQKVQDDQAAIPFYRQVKTYGVLLFVGLSSVSLLIIITGYYNRLTVFVLKIGKHSQIPIKHRDLAKLSPEITTSLALAEQMKSEGKSTEKAFELYEKSAEILSKQLSTIIGRYGIYGKQGVLPMEAPAHTLALPEAITKVPTLGELLETGEIAPGKPLIFGYRKDTGAPEKGTLQDQYSCFILGLSGSGKTTFLAYTIGASIIAERASFVILDLHYPSPESLGSTLGKLTQTPFVRMVSNPFDLPNLLTEIRNELTRRLANPTGDLTPYILVVDEHERWVKHSPKLLSLEMEIVNEGRKVKMYLFITSKSAKADKVGDSALRDNCVTSYVFRTKTQNAHTFFRDKEKEILVKQLREPGEAIFTNRHDDSFCVKIPFASNSDIHSLCALLPVNQATEPVNQTTEPARFVREPSVNLTSEQCKQLREQQNLSQSDLANLAGVSLSKLKRFELKGASWEQEELNQLLRVLFQREPQDLNQVNQLQQSVNQA